MEIFHLVYKSHAAENYTHEQIQEMVKKAQKFNQEHQLTGLLVFRNGSFLQLLEGPEDVVRNLYKKIKADPRHIEVETIIEAKSQERIYPQWSMVLIDEKTNEVSSRDLFDLFDSLAKDSNTEKILIFPILKKFQK